MPAAKEFGNRGARGEAFAGDTAVVTAGAGILVAWDAPYGLPERLRPTLNGAPLRAAALVRAEKTDGALRLFAGLEIPASHGILSLIDDEDHCLLQIPIDRRVVDLPGSDSLHPGRLTNGLTVRGWARLVAFLVQFCAGLLKADADPGFRALCLGVIAAGGLLQPLQVRYGVTTRHLLAEGPVLPVGPAPAIYVVGREMMRRLDFLPRFATGPRGASTWLCVPPECVGKTIAVALGNDGIAACLRIPTNLNGGSNRS